jgi:hypothetical protein
MRHSCLTSSLFRLGRAALFATAFAAVAAPARATYPPDPTPLLDPVVGDGMVVLRWDLTLAGADQVTTYVVYRTTVSGEWTATATLYHDFEWSSHLEARANTRSYWDEGLTNGVVYSYTIRAQTRSGTCFADSATIWVTPRAGYTDPFGPVIAESGDKWVRLSWNLGTTWWATEPLATIYRVFRATDPGMLGRYAASSSLHAEINADTSYTDLAAVTNKVSYYYMVFPAYPERSPFFIRAFPVRPIYSTGQPTARIDGSGPRRIRVSWEAAPAPDLTQSDDLWGYAVFRSDDGGGTMEEIFRVPKTTLSVLDEVPSYGKRYVYLVRPVDTASRLGDAYPLAMIDVELPSNRLYLNHNRFRPKLGETLQAIFQVTEAGRIRISVMSLTGEKIKTIYDQELAGSYSPDNPYNSLFAGVPTPVWDGKNDSGRLVGSGAYLVVLEIGSHRYIGSVAVIR